MARRNNRARDFVMKVMNQILGRIYVVCYTLLLCLLLFNR